MRKRFFVGAAALALTALAVGLAVPASAVVPGESVPANTVAIPLTRIVDTPGDGFSAGSTVVVKVAGTSAGIPANAVAVTGRLVAYDTAAGESLVVWDGISGAPGDPTVTSDPTPVTHPSGASNAFSSALNNTDLSVHLLRGSGRFLLEVTSYQLPAPPAPAPTAFGVANIMVHTSATSDAPSVWGTFDTVLAGGPVGDIAAGFTRFTCKLAAGCDLTVTAYSTQSGETIYPDVLLTREDNTTGGKFTCEYADGSDNNGATTALTGTKASPTAVPLGIGLTADCGSTVQTGGQPASVTHINVPGTDGQGDHYDVDVKFTFAPATS